MSDKRSAVAVTAQEIDGMDIDMLIERLAQMKANGVKRVFVKDTTTSTLLDVIDTGVDNDGDGIIMAD